MSTIIYHGSVDIVKSPEIRLVTRPLDFGIGFYASTIKERAEDWARKKAKKANLTPIVNVYRLDMPALKEQLDVKFFEHTSDDWLDFVLHHRKVAAYTIERSASGGRRLGMRQGIHHSYDMVMGEVADDDVFDAITLYESSIISRDDLILRLRTKKLNDQLCFCTQNALSYLEFVGG